MSRCFTHNQECQESVYLYWGTIPIGLAWGSCFLVGFCFLLCYLSLCCKDVSDQDSSGKNEPCANGPKGTKKKGCWKTCKSICAYLRLLFLKVGNLVARLLLGGKLGLLRETKKTVKEDKFEREVMYINELLISDKSHLLHFMLGLKFLVFLAFCLATGADIFFVQSKLTCDASLDCYKLDTNYNEFPLTDCTEALNSENITAVCYELVFDLSGAVSAMGGLVTISLIETAIIAYLSIAIYQKCFQESNWCLCCNLCGTSCSKKSRNRSNQNIAEQPEQASTESVSEDKICCCSSCYQYCKSCRLCFCFNKSYCFRLCCCCRKRCCGEEKKNCYNLNCCSCRTCCYVFLQLTCAFLVVLVPSVIYLFLKDLNAEISMLRRAGNWITFLGYPCSVAFSILVPWQLVVDHQPPLKERVGTTQPQSEFPVDSRELSGTSLHSEEREGTTRPQSESRKGLRDLSGTSLHSLQDTSRQSGDEISIPMEPDEKSCMSEM